MRVLYILRYFPTLTETFVYREIDALRDHGIDVTIAALGSRADGDIQGELPDATVLAVPRRPMTGRLSRPTPGQHWLEQGLRKKDAARLPWLAARLEGISRVHTHFAGEASEWAHALAMDTGLPFSVTVHAVDLFKPRPRFDEVLRAAQSVITIADHHRTLLVERGHDPVVVRCGPELAAWQASPADLGPLHAIAVGRAVPKKGLELLLDAWARLDRPGARLDLVSDIADPGLPGVVVHGLRPPAEVRALMRAANLAVLPCRRAPDGDMDGIPLSLMEALAASRAVLTTPLSGIPELVDEQVGWVVPADDADAVMCALRHAADDPELRRSRGVSGPDRLISRGFTLSAQATGIARLWDSQPASS